MKQHLSYVRKSMYYLFSLIILTCFIGINSIFAATILQRLEIPSSPNPVGSGARAIGMGGAFIAVADDATAASWNPGGLMQLELPEISFVGEFFHRTEDNAFSAQPEASGKQSVNQTSMNYLSAAYPFNLWNHNMIVSINYQKLYDFTRKWNFPLINNSQGLKTAFNADYQQEGRLSAVGLAYCIQATPRLSIGMTLNIWDDGLFNNSWEQKTLLQGSGTDANGTFTSESRSYDRYSFSGFNANFGILWNVNSKLSIGAVLKTPFEADIEHEHSFSGSISYPDSSGSDSITSNMYYEDASMYMPMSYGIGFAYRFSKKFTMSADFYRTEWDDFEFEDSQGNRTSPITGKPSGQSDIDPSHHVRMGAEYLIIKPKYVLPLRAGIFYDPSPASGRPDPFYGFSLGSGIGYKQFIFDIAYQCRFGNDAGDSILQEFEFSQDVQEHKIYSSVIIHF